MKAIWMSLALALNTAGCGSRSGLPGGPEADPGPSQDAGFDATDPDAGVSSPVRVQIAAGYAHTCALNSAGEVACWGLNNSGQLGDPDAAEVERRPRRVPGLDGVTHIAASSHATCAVRNNAEVWCWGSVSLAGEPNQSVSTPRLIWQLPSDPGVKVAGIEQLALGTRHGCALLANQRLLCWGDGGDGRLGDGDTTYHEEPVELPVEVLEVAAGSENTCVVTTQSQLVCFGSNLDGASGAMFNVSNVPTPTPVTGGDNSLNLGSKTHHSCAIRAGGQVVCWGANREQQLGREGQFCCEDGAEPADRVAPALQVATGDIHSCAVLETGRVACWGSNSLGQRGGYSDSSQPLQPTLITGLPEVAQLELGLYHSCVLSVGGEVLCWGNNRDGQLGQPAALSKTETPVAPEW